MDSNSIHNGIDIVVWILLVIGIVARLRAVFAVRYSHQRYVYASLHILAYGLIAICRFVDAVLWSIDGEFLIASVALLTVPIWIFLIWIAWDDDNWFNNRFKRLKKGWKKLRSWRPQVPRIFTPHPAPSPN